MSAVGQFTTLHGEARLPLPRREAAASAVGGAPGSAVCAADWAYLVEALAERGDNGPKTTPSWSGASRRRFTPPDYAVHRHSLFKTIHGVVDTELHYFPHWLANDLAKEVAPLFMDPEWNPPTSLSTAADGEFHDAVDGLRLSLSQRNLATSPDVWYPFGSIYSGVDWHEYQYRARRTRQDGLFARRADGLRRMYYDVLRMRRRLCVVEAHRAMKEQTGSGAPQDADSESAYYSSIFKGGFRDVTMRWFTDFSLGSDILNIAPGVVVRPISETAPTFVVVQAYARCWDESSGVVQNMREHLAWFAVPTTLGGALDFSWFNSDALKTWAEALFEPGTRESYDASARVWNGNVSLSSHGSEADVYVFRDLSFPIDIQTFGALDSWNWTPPTST